MILSKVRNFFEGDLRFRTTRVPKWVVVGVAGVVLMYVATAGIVSTTAPWWLGRGDTRAHVDYIWRLYNGDIPKFDQGITYPPFQELSGGGGVQSAAANPPAFYVIHLPIVGPLLQSGEWRYAIAAGRAVNILLGVLCVIALSWAGWLLGGNKRALMAVSVPALTVLMYRFTILNLDYANDALILLLFTLSFINIYKLITKGPKGKYLVSLTLLTIIGLLTKAPYIVMAACSYLGIVLSYALNGRVVKISGVAKGLKVAVPIALITLIASGWFYYLWNYQTSGSWFAASPEGYTGGRTYKSIYRVLTDPVLWGHFYANFSRVATLSTAMASFAAAGLLTVSSGKIKGLLKDKRRLSFIFIMLLATAGVFMTQVVLAVGYGSINFRYMIPVLLPYGLILAYGLLQNRRLRGSLVPIFSILLGISTIRLATRSPSVVGVISDIKTKGGTLDQIIYALEFNGIPGGLSYLLLALFFIGSVLLTLSILSLSRVKQRQLPQAPVV